MFFNLILSEFIVSNSLFRSWIFLNWKQFLNKNFFLNQFFKTTFLKIRFFIFWNSRIHFVKIQVYSYLEIETNLIRFGIVLSLFVECQWTDTSNRESHDFAQCHSNETFLSSFFFFWQFLVPTLSIDEVSVFSHFFRDPWKQKVVCPEI